jgi:2',3'-cyclic-nucleotide 2'-phosphodiesterase (5'-nucleotidase family)
MTTHLGRSSSTVNDAMIDSSSHYSDTTAASTVAITTAITHDVYTLHAGDALTGSLFYTAYGPKIDATWMNAANVFDVMVLGNHEFDEVCCRKKNMVVHDENH